MWTIWTAAPSRSAGLDGYHLPHAPTFTPVAHVAPTREISVLPSVIAGSLTLKAGHLRRRLDRAAVILAGMSLPVAA